MVPTVWMSPLHNCGGCEKPFSHVEGTPMYDAAVMGSGPWGNFCQECFEALGCKLGMGKGQRYALTTLEHGRAWVLTAGMLEI